ncbi:phosphoribosylformylglycinamidine synthase subunit PurQ [Cerasicoccus frondis]|uniref:phosphoribosylformylglycinamidine synthase subunit PurQ n=1 Tax=Cerasicoccus frondis TaxID=490090 RepID=UPI0028526977|nr:phosphoribosylformylglycinamidine synthase subunit PurQ [Cerasicoccus frondis]
MKVAVLQLPGTTGDRDLYYALVGELHVRARLFNRWTKSFSGADALIIPGGASFGDHLRAGALAKLTPAVQAVKEFAAGGGPVLGIGNGFQVLCEAGLLPGALMENNSGEYRCGAQSLLVDDSTQNFNKRRLGEDVSLPIGHRYGRYWIDNHGLNSLKDKQQIIFRYENNPNGSVADIAGIRNVDENVFGMMPHPEAAVEQSIHMNITGAKILRAFLKQPRVEPKKPALEGELKEKVEALLLEGATSLSVDRIYAYIPNYNVMLTVNGTRKIDYHDTEGDVGKYMKKFIANENADPVSDIATSFAEHVVISSSKPKVTLLTVGNRQKTALARLRFSIEKFHENLNDAIDG